MTEKMTEQEALLILNYRISRFDNAEDINQALDVAKNALEENQQYRAIGTVEKVREYKEIADNMNAVSMAKLCVSLNKLEKYERVGTLEECRAAVDKQKAHKWERGIER